MEELSIVVTAYFGVGLLTFIFGHVLLLRQRQERTRWNNEPKVTPLTLFWEQVVIGMFHPWCAVGVLGACLVIPFMILPIMLLEGNGRFISMRDAVYLQQSDANRRAFKERYGMEWRIVSTRDSVEHTAWMERIFKEEERRAKLVQNLSEITVQAASFAVLVLSLLVSTFTIGVKKAMAGEREDEIAVEQPIEKVEKPFEPEVNLHGVVSLKGTLAPIGEANDLTWSLAQADLKIIADPSPNLNVFARFGFATFASGGTDPVLAAFGTWKPSKGFALQAGRVITPVGFSRQPPGESKIELSYPATAATAPLFDHGVIAQMRPLDKLALDIGLVTGHGTAIEIDALPDMLARAEVRPSKTLLLGISGQSGLQPSGWRHIAEMHGELDHEHITLQTEFSGSSAMIDDDVVIGRGWWLLAAARPIKILEPYARVALLHPGVPGSASANPVLTTGINLKPDKNVAIRAALELPLGRGSAPSATLLGQFTF